MGGLETHGETDSQWEQPHAVSQDGIIGEHVGAYQVDRKRNAVRDPQPQLETAIHREVRS